VVSRRAEVCALHATQQGYTAALAEFVDSLQGQVDDKLLVQPDALAAMTYTGPNIQGPVLQIAKDVELDVPGMTLPESAHDKLNMALLDFMGDAVRFLHRRGVGGVTIRQGTWLVLCCASFCVGFYVDTRSFVESGGMIGVDIQVPADQKGGTPTCRNFSDTYK
jgi:hypothetical protein